MSDSVAERSVPHQARMTAVGQVTGSVVHDVNNALTVVVWNLERLAASTALPEKESETAKKALHSTLKAVSLLHRLLDYARSDSYDPDAFDLEELLSRLLPSLETAVEGDIGVKYETSGSLGPVLGDSILIELCLLDLAVTLSRNMAPGGIITLSAGTLPAGENAPQEANIVLAISCTAMTRESPMTAAEAGLAQHIADLAGGVLVLSAAPAGGCDIRLYLPPAPMTADGQVAS